MDDTRILQLLSQAIEQKLFPGAAVGFIHREGISHQWAAGQHTYNPLSPKTTPQTLFDVASVSKTFPTTTLALLLEKSGTWQLGDRLSQWLPQWQGEPSITLEDLVCFRPEFALTLSQHKDKSSDQLLEIILSAHLASPLGTKSPVYSNATSILLSLAIEQATGMPLDRATTKHLFEPLTLSRTTFNPQLHFTLSEIAPSEHDPWRNMLLHGVVHDESAWQLQQNGHFPGSAGVFSCVEDCLTFLQWRMNSLPDSRGWEGYSPEWMSDSLSLQSYGKTGFTGCLIVIDPEVKTGFAILSNAVHPKRPVNREPLQQFRREMLSALVAVSEDSR